MSEGLFGGMIGVDSPTPPIEKRTTTPYTITQRVATLPRYPIRDNPEPYPEDFDPTSDSLREGGLVWLDGARLTPKHWQMLYDLPKEIVNDEHPLEHKCLDCTPEWHYSHKCLRCPPHDNFLVSCRHSSSYTDEKEPNGNV